MTKAAAMAWLERERVVPVVRADSADGALATVDALLEGGVSTFEITMTVPGAVDVMRQVERAYGERVLLGAGTVLDAETARACVDAGARFVVSPALDLATVAACAERGVLVAPGALTPTEILVAWRAGADLIKVFPCDALGGAKYLRSLRAPLPDVPLMPTGGVTLESLQDFLRAGARAVGVGSDLVDPTLPREELAARARAFVARAKSV